MSHWQMYQKPKYVQDDAVWVERGEGPDVTSGPVCSNAELT